VSGSRSQRSNLFTILAANLKIILDGYDEKVSYLVEYRIRIGKK